MAVLVDTRALLRAAAHRHRDREHAAAPARRPRPAHARERPGPGGLAPPGGPEGARRAGPARAGGAAERGRARDAAALRGGGGAAGPGARGGGGRLHAHPHARRQPLGRGDARPPPRRCAPTSSRWCCRAGAAALLVAFFLVAFGAYVVLAAAAPWRCGRAAATPPSSPRLHERTQKILDHIPTGVLALSHDGPHQRRQPGAARARLPGTTVGRAAHGRLPRPRRAPVVERLAALVASAQQEDRPAQPPGRTAAPLRRGGHVQPARRAARAADDPKRGDARCWWWRT